MNTYLIPICDSSSVYIEPVCAKNLSEAKKRIMNDYLSDSDPVPADWEDFKEILSEDNFTFGDFYELSEF